MARNKRRKHELNIGQFQDPGKDLFAFLFLMVMIFSFMVLISSQQIKKQNPSENSIEQKSSSAQTSIKPISKSLLGKLEKKENNLYIIFDNVYYNPKKDLNKLKDDKRIDIIKRKDGRVDKVLYLEKNKSSTVLLGEYLDIFQILNQEGISIAFSERM